MSTTLNMNMVLPDPSITLGPTWAQLLNTALGLIDAHDHTSGKGVQITPAGININADLSFNSKAATLLKYAGLSSQGGTLTGNGLVYRVGNDLYYNNGAGVAIQVTAGTAVNASGSGAISVNVIVSYPYTVLASDAQKVLIIDTTAARTINLPSAVTAMFVMIKDGKTLAQTNNISIVPNGADTIDGVNATYLLNWNDASVGLVSDGVTKWYVV